MIKTTIKDQNFLKHKTDSLIVHCLEEKKPKGILKDLDRILNGSITSAMKNKRFEGKLNQSLLLNSRAALEAENVLLVGLGKAADLTGDRICQASGTAAKRAENTKCKKVSIYMQDGALEKAMRSVKAKSCEDPACLVAQGCYLALYHFDHYKTNDGDDPPSRVEEIVLLAPDKKRSASMVDAVDYARKISAAVCLARDLGSHPSNTVTPTYLANEAKKTARKNGMTCKILQKKDMEKLGMGSFLGVAKGAHEPPAFIVLEYTAGPKSLAPIVIVGKGITFDTGGISLKPAGGMDEMKMDMSGGAVTLATLQAAASLKLPVNLVGLIPATENMPGGSAIKPGDILTSMSGKTIEVLNTDAEGRLVLADALSYAQRYKPEAVIDLATLTGAVVVALGSHASAVIGNDADLTEKLIKSGTASGERLWELPLWEEYEKSVKSNIADLKNIASAGVGAGTITGAAFLKPFAGDQPWCHIDIAGTSWYSDNRPLTPKGSSGFGVRLLINFLEEEIKSRKKKKR